jgi:hypothetical protein
MMPACYALALYRGDTGGPWRFLLWADAAKTVPTDLTGVTVRSEFRRWVDGPVEYTMPCVITLPNIIDAAVPPADSATLPEVGAWDLELTYPDGTVKTVVAGAVTVRSDVTRAVAL